jgi:predicted phage gp36 major capsid-like protein
VGRIFAAGLENSLDHGASARIGDALRRYLHDHTAQQEELRDEVRRGLDAAELSLPQDRRDPARERGLPRVRHRREHDRRSVPARRDECDREREPPCGHADREHEAPAAAVRPHQCTERQLGIGLRYEGKRGITRHNDSRTGRE